MTYFVSVLGKIFKCIFLQNHLLDLTHIWFVTSLGALDYIVYKLGHCDLLSKNGGHESR